jgi:uncharacterized membrane protein YhaH (DUF805 family)
MLDSIFSFQGRIGRLHYFLRTLCIGAAMGVLSTLGIGLAVFTRAPGMTAILALLGVGLFAAFLWASFALQARRLRDIGGAPLYIIPAWCVFTVMDVLVAHTVPALAVGLMHSQTFLGALVNLGLQCCLLCWPSKADDLDAPAAASGGWPEADPEPVIPVAAPVAFRPASPAVSFGRRGL